MFKCMGDYFLLGALITCRCPKQKRKEEEVACPTKGKVQQGRVWAKGIAREVRRTFKILRKV